MQNDEGDKYNTHSSFLLVIYVSPLLPYLSFVLQREREREEDDEDGKLLFVYTIGSYWFVTKKSNR